MTKVVHSEGGQHDFIEMREKLEIKKYEDSWEQVTFRLPV